MAHSTERFQRRIATFNRTLLLFMLCAFSLSACNRTDTPSPPATPKPQTGAGYKFSEGLKKAIYSYSAKPDASYPVNHPATQHRIVLET